jgi:tRNA(Ile2) C34 agmatinyltransferase TiaS
VQLTKGKKRVFPEMFCYSNIADKEKTKEKMCPIEARHVVVKIHSKGKQIDILFAENFN